MKRRSDGFFDQTGSVSPLEEHEDFILGLIKEQPDMTLDEIVAAMKKAKIAASRTAVWRFFDRLQKLFAASGRGQQERLAAFRQSLGALDADFMVEQPSKVGVIQTFAMAAGRCRRARSASKPRRCVWRPPGWRSMPLASK
jgi:hypothetical protein